MSASAALAIANLCDPGQRLWPAAEAEVTNSRQGNDNYRPTWRLCLCFILFF